MTTVNAIIGENLFREEFLTSEDSTTPALKLLPQLYALFKFNLTL